MIIIQINHTVKLLLHCDITHYRCFLQMKEDIFICYLTVAWPTLRHRRDSLTQLMLSTALKPVFNLKVHKSLLWLLLVPYCDWYPNTMSFLNFFWYFFYSKHLKTEYCLPSFHLQIFLTAHVPVFLKHVLPPNRIGSIGRMSTKWSLNQKPFTFISKP